MSLHLIHNVLADLRYNSDDQEETGKILRGNRDRHNPETDVSRKDFFILIASPLGSNTVQYVSVPLFLIVNPTVLYSYFFHDLFILF